MQFTYLPVDERFSVKVVDEVCDRFAAGMFSTASNYPVFAIRLFGDVADNRTEFMLPASDGSFVWLNVEDTRLARR